MSSDDRAVRIVARSFYKELERAGLDHRQIIRVATELIGCLNDSLEQNRQRAKEDEPPEVVDRKALAASG